MLVYIGAGAGCVGTSTLLLVLAVVLLSALIALLTRWCVCGLVGAVCVGAGGGYAGARVAAGGRALLALCWCSCC